MKNVETPGLPVGEYEVCTSAKIGTAYRRLIKTVAVTVSGTSLTMDLGPTGYEAGLQC